MGRQRGKERGDFRETENGVANCEGGIKRIWGKKESWMKRAETERERERVGGDGIWTKSEGVGGKEMDLERVEKEREMKSERRHGGWVAE